MILEAHPLPIALAAFRRHQALSDLGHYTGILSLHGFCRLARNSGRDDLLDEARQILRGFLSRQVEIRYCNYENYRCGGNGAAWLLREGLFDEAREQVGQLAEQTLHEAPRARSGLYCHPREPHRERVFIDQLFAVCPFLMYAGQALGRDEYLTDACLQAVGMVELLRDPASGLLHQGVNFAGPGSCSQDHWSRGNGWGLFAVAELVGGLRPDDPRRQAVVAIYRDLIEACLRTQDAEGLWHQELTEPDSYVETSGTGLILYAIGVGLQAGLLGEQHHEAFRRGLTGYLRYVALDGSVFHTCRGCACPGDGSIAAYRAVPWVLNDPHAFGPVVLAFGQALALGITALGPA